MLFFIMTCHILLYVCILPLHIYVDVQYNIMYAFLKFITQDIFCYPLFLHILIHDASNKYSGFC